MRTCESCGREYNRKGKKPACPFCGWMNGNPRYWLDRDPSAVKTRRKGDGRFDYQISVLAEYKP